MNDIDCFFVLGFLLGGLVAGILVHKIENDVWKLSAVKAGVATYQVNSNNYQPEFQWITNR